MKASTSVEYYGQNFVVHGDSTPGLHATVLNPAEPSSFEISKVLLQTAYEGVFTGEVDLTEFLLCLTDGKLGVLERLGHLAADSCDRGA